MTTLSIENRKYDCQPEETVLDALLRQKVDTPFGCKKGVCHSCMLRSLDVTPPAKSQEGIKDTLKVQNYFLSCCCTPEQDMTIKLSNQAEAYIEGKVVVHEMLNRNTLLLGLACKEALDYNAGQFVNLKRPDGLTRSYSISNTPEESKTIDFHIRQLPEGRFSEWACNELKLGDSLQISEAHGHCFYLPDRKEQGMLLVGTGTGLAPLEGILSDALSQGHSGSIRLFHGSSEVEDLYKIEEMRELSSKHDNFSYTPCVSGSKVPEGFSKGRVNEVALNAIADLSGWRVFLCGHPDMVSQMKTDSFQKGASVADIYVDAFLASGNSQ